MRKNITRYIFYTLAAIATVALSLKAWHIMEDRNRASSLNPSEIIALDQVSQALLLYRMEYGEGAVLPAFGMLSDFEVKSYGHDGATVRLSESEEVEAITERLIFAPITLEGTRGPSRGNDIAAVLLPQGGDGDIHTLSLNGSVRSYRKIR